MYVCPTVARSGSSLLHSSVLRAFRVPLGSDAHMLFRRRTQEFIHNMMGSLCRVPSVCNLSDALQPPRTLLSSGQKGSALVSLLLWALPTVATVSRIKWWEDGEHKISESLHALGTIIPINKRMCLTSGCQCHCCLHQYTTSWGSGQEKMEKNTNDKQETLSPPPHLDPQDSLSCSSDKNERAPLGPLPVWPSAHFQVWGYLWA